MNRLPFIARLLSGDGLYLISAEFSGCRPPAIRTARTGSQVSLDLVKDWFQLSTPLIEPEFTLEELVDIGLQMVRNIHSDFSPRLVEEIPEMPRMISALTVFTDIFFIVFDNIRRHAGVHRTPLVEIRATDLGERLQVMIRNEVGPGMRTADVERKVSKIKESIASGAYQTAVRLEGGTGFIKLRKILDRDPEFAARLEFGFDDAGMFCVAFEVRTMEVRNEGSTRGR